MSIRKYSAGLFSVASGLLLKFVLIPIGVPIPPYAEASPGLTPSAFPNVLAYSLIILGIFSLVFSLMEKSGAQDDDVSTGNAVSHKTLARRTIFLSLATAGYLVGLYTLGFNISTFIFLMGFLILAGKKGWIFSILVTIGTILIINIIFSYLLNAPLPEGIILSF